VKAACLLIALAGCAQLVEPDVGPPLRAACTNIDTDPGHDISFSRDIAPVIAEYHCTTCHTPSGNTPIGLIVGGLDLTSVETLRAGGARSGASIVVPGKGCDSVLLQKVEPGPPFGSRMPLDGPPYLDDEDLELISDWIIEGAHDN
jgi:Planctomycete cytochrome C